jgi:hypothetical protein
MMVDSNESSGRSTPDHGVHGQDLSGSGTGTAGGGGAAGGAGGLSTDKILQNIGNSEYVYECLTTVMGVKEESSSLYLFLFEDGNMASSFEQRFLKAVEDYRNSLVLQRMRTFIEPQAVMKLLISGQVVANPVGPGGFDRRELCRFGGNEVLVRQVSHFVHQFDFFRHL